MPMILDCILRKLECNGAAATVPVEGVANMLFAEPSEKAGLHHPTDATFGAPGSQQRQLRR